MDPVITLFPYGHVMLENVFAGSVILMVYTQTKINPKSSNRILAIF